MTIPNADNNLTPRQKAGQTRSQKAREAYDANPKTCPTCGDTIPFAKRRNRFCGQSCAATERNKGVTRHAKHPKECAHCGEVKETRQNKYCDRCIEARVYNPPAPLEDIVSPAGIRRHLLRTRPHQCENCDLETWLGEAIYLEVHHIDGNPDNNTEENLQLLCGNCHGLTKNYKDSARAYGKKGLFSRRRKMRRKRYSEGKSW